ncbi:hypothetical protein J1605_006836 [Eschrichtius robustus]|uniref:Oxidative stress-induced growth inhibitor 1 n=1 Tax=Eschrichtius robustus TaxID=9764 RepID=A0AB34GZE4_ESCRO|nr:hypothetical protein J1605_006836 [Eschrichtius robustus]
MSNGWKDHLGASGSEPLPVVIIGNGPSGICLSYLLSGYSPYVKPDAIHPHPVLQRKLTEAPGVSIVDQVGLSSGWEGHPHCGKTLPGKNQKDAFMRHKTKRVRDHKISHRNWGRGITAVFEDLQIPHQLVSPPLDQCF